VHLVGSHCTEFWFVSVQDMILFSPQKRPGKLWGTSVLFKGREANLSYPSSAELRMRTAVLSFPFYIQNVHRNNFIFSSEILEYIIRRNFFLVLASVNILHYSRRSLKYSHLFRFCMMYIGTVRLFSSYWKRRVV